MVAMVLSYRSVSKQSLRLFRTTLQVEDCGVPEEGAVKSPTMALILARCLWRVVVPLLALARLRFQLETIIGSASVLDLIYLSLTWSRQ
jgi:hypothetical protein